MCKLIYGKVNRYLTLVAFVGIVLGIGCGLVREAAGLVLGAYFKRRRQFVELVAHAGGGVGIALFSVAYKEAVGYVEHFFTENKNLVITSLTRYFQKHVYKNKQTNLHKYKKFGTYVGS